MSFSFEVKEELCRCRGEESAVILSELCGISLFGQTVKQDHLKITTENVLVINRLQDLTSAVIPGVYFSMNETVSAYTAELRGEALRRFYRYLCVLPDNRPSVDLPEDRFRSDRQVNAFLRGAVMSGGYFSDPSSAYHFELVTPYYSLAKATHKLMLVHQIPCKMVMRRSNYVIYLKGSRQIYDLLYRVGARSAAFELMNVVIAKETSNHNNRLENCNAYNMDKALNKSVEQVKAIDKIEEKIGLSALSPDLSEAAQLRKTHPTASLTELSRLSGGKISRAGFSRKLNRIIEIASELKE